MRIKKIVKKLPAFEWWLLGLVLLLGFLLRLYRLNTPLADWHSWRQADTASVAYRFCQEGIDLLRPRFHDLSNIPSGLDNPQGWRFVEFPLYNALHCLSYRFLDQFNLSFEVSGRLVSILLSLGSAIFLYLLVKRLSGRKVAFLASLFFLTLPFNIYYSRVILPEPMLVFLSLGWLDFFVTWLDKKKLSWLVLSVLFFSLGLLIKPTIAFFSLAPAYLYFKKNFNKKSLFQVSLVYFLAFVPFFIWRVWMSRFPAGIPAYLWLLNQNNIRLRPAWWRWLFADRLGRLVLGYWGLLPFSLGLMTRPEKRSGWFYHLWLIGAFLYLLVFATGNVTHDYYQVVLMPIVAIFLARGVLAITRLPLSLFKHSWRYLVLVFSLVFMLAFSWFNIRDFYNINHPEIVIAGQVVDRILPQEAVVIAPYNGDTAFLYQTKRTGWPIGFEIEDKIEKGAQYYISVNMDDEANDLAESCQVVEKTNQYIIIDLQNCVIPTEPQASGGIPF